ncbi:hypothetical protein E6R60_05710 [Streptomyces sp. A0642]|uniref:hypothetical protein n=1 Tax=Streptomyces sp. A0642 TaxID=2563100 RepID=UPI0010A2485E|nr:hypothetical protein [Streptomyces sp. A0642]THA78381.1 hypothetical protein E6R60_05710 [Streptomyces sp. A0642]
MQHLTHSRIAAALAAATQPEGERPWRLLLTKAPMTYADTRRWVVLEQNADLRQLAGIDEATCRAEASRARIINDLARRDAYMHALSVSEQLMSSTPVLPTAMRVDMAPWNDGPTILWSFHRDRDAVASFAAHFGISVTERPHDDEGTSTYVSTTGVIDGVQVEAYALVDAAPEQVAA